MSSHSRCRWELLLVRCRHKSSCCNYLKWSNIVDEWWSHICMDIDIFVEVFLIQVDDSLYIYYFWFVNSPLLLELPPCGQVQVMKASRCWLLCLRALIRNEMGNRCLFLHSFMYHFFFKNMLLKIYLLNNILSCWGLCAKIWLKKIYYVEMNIPLQFL